MKNFIYIKNDGLQLVRKNNKTCIYEEYPLQLGAVLNGVIINANAVKDCIGSISPSIKKADIIIDSSNIMSKKLQTPKINNRQLSELIKGEFDLYQKEDLYQFDFNVIGTGNNLSVMAYAVNKELAESYINIFKECDIKIGRVDIVANGIINYVKGKAELNNKTFLLNIIVGQNMLSLLFENGEYKLTNRVRLVEKSNGELYYQELYRRLSSMLQFHQSERSSYTIEQSFYIGLSEQEIKEFVSYTTGIIDLKISNFADPSLNLDYLYPCLLSYKNKKDLNFAINQEHLQDKQSKNKDIKIKATILAVIVLCGVAYGTFVYINYLGAKNTNNELNEYIISDKVLTGLAEYESLNKENTSTIKEKKAIDSAITKVFASTILTEECLNEIYKSDYVNSLSYDEANFSIAIDGKCPTSKDAVAYAQRLRNSGFFDAMEYHGYVVETYNYIDDLYDYNYEEEYSFKITGTLKNTQEDTEND